MHHTEREIRDALKPYAQPSNRIGYLLFTLEQLSYWAALAMVLFAPGIAWKVAASLFCGLRLSAFVTLGHDAAHRTLVANQNANKWLAIALFLPCMHNYRLWVWDHHQIHHPETNGDHFDSYTPLSKDEFDRLSWPRQLFERFIRAPNLIGFGMHYLFQRMPAVRIWPRPSVPLQYRASAWRHFWLLVAYHAAFLSLLCLAPLFAPVSLVQSLVLGFALPLFVFAMLTGGSLYLMHTHPSIRWHRGEAGESQRLLMLSATHLSLPRPISMMVHNVFAHSAHHAHAGIPSYRLFEAQGKLDELLGDCAVSEPMTLRGVLRTMKTCKLYDYEAHRWLDFDGRATADIDAPSTLGAGAPRRSVVGMRSSLEHA